MLRRLFGTKRGLNWLLVLALLLSPIAPVLQAADSATSVAATAEVAKASLDRILAGATPMGVADLKAMQEHVRKLTDQLVKCTVGVQVGPAQGSGVIISKDGYVLTAAHVAGQPKKDVKFFFADGTTKLGKTLGLNRTLDAGLMKIDGVDDLPFAEMGLSDQLKEGQWCLATGHPGGYQSDRKPVLRMGRVLLPNDEVIISDCTLVGGDSGGPLFDMQGKVIGINSRISTALNSNMHVPVGTFKDTWDRLSNSEAWGHYPGNDPYLGVSGEEGSKEAKIVTVKPDSPASKAGLQPGDIVLKIDDQELTDFPSLTAAVRERQPRDWARLVIKRGEETKEIRVRIGKKD